MTKNFVHLHNHTEYSLLDGAQTLKELFEEVNRLGMPAVAQTDHGNMLGTYDFYKAATAAGVIPIIGMEAYCAPGKTPRSHKKPVLFGQGGSDDVSNRGAYTHMTLLATTGQGIRNLQKMSSLAYLEGQFRHPRIDRDLMETFHQGIIATTGCPSGEIQTYLRLGKYEQAKHAASELQDIFGKENYFLELMDHGLELEKRVTKQLLQLATDLNIPLLATNDAHYIKASDAKKHEHLLCINSGSTMDIPTGDGPNKRFAFTGETYYIRTAEEMRELFKELPQACDNTLEIAQRVDPADIATVFQPQNLMPNYPIDIQGRTEAEEFEQQVWDGLNLRYPEGVSEDRKQRAQYEIDVINQMGFPGYFLVVADFINWAKENGIRVGPGRGSGAGSLVAYAMRITELDPIVHNLLFERFLNPERVSMPDFDIDFDELRRGEVIEYVNKKYGKEYVAQIVTLGRIKAKQAVKDSARILGFPYVVGDRLNKMMPKPVMGKMPKLKEIFDSTHSRYSESQEFRDAYQTQSDTKKVVDTALEVEGLIRQTGVHAAGVIMSSQPLQEIIPVMDPKNDGNIVTQWEYPTCEELGMIKMDFLGLSNLTTIDETLKNIKRNKNIELDLTELDKTLNDPATFKLLATGDTLGVFQLDGIQMRALLKSMQPDTFEDISAVIALYRPGPMGVNAHNDYADRKTKRKPVKPIHPELKTVLEPILGETYGLIVYQEQVMAIAQQLAGYTLGSADILRRAMGKKKKEELEKQHSIFQEGMRQNNYSDESIDALWSTLLPFADYAFNRAHSASYGVISYYTAYLKANYPAEYMAALLTTNADDKTKTALYLNECRRMGIKVLPPDVNDSIGPYAAVDDSIRVGLGAIRNVGTGAVTAIIEGRKNHTYKSFIDFLENVEVGGLNKRSVESLIKAGSFDSLNHQRRSLDLIHQQAFESVMSLKKAEAAGQDSLFSSMDETENFGVSITIPENVKEWDKMTLLNYEKEMLGLYVSDHPLNGVSDFLRAKTEVSVGQIIESPGSYVGKKVTIGGLITGLERKVTKKGQSYATFTTEDIDGELNIIAFPNVYSDSADFLVADGFVLVQGKLERNDDDSLKILAEKITSLDTSQAAIPDPITLTVSEKRLTQTVVEELKETLKRHPGIKPVHLRVISPTNTKIWALAEEYKITKSTQCVGDLRILLGPECFNEPETNVSESYL